MKVKVKKKSLYENMNYIKRKMFILIRKAKNYVLNHVLKLILKPYN